MSQQSIIAVTRLFTDPVHRPENPFIIIGMLNKAQWLAFIAAFLGWTMDAMDFFVFNMVVSNMAAEFGVQPSTITSGITLTLLFRPIGALIFGILGDMYGRRGPLMLDIVLYSVLEAATGFSGNLTTLFIIRALFGICLGGEWGLGAALALESLPVEARGLFGGVLQQGYAFGSLLASGLFYAVVPNLGWRASFWIGASPAVLVIFIRFFVPESEAVEAQIARRKETSTSFSKDLIITLKKNWITTIYCIVFMTAFSFLSHGSQDLFPTYLSTALHFNTNEKAATTAVASIGAIVGGASVGFFSQYLGRRRAIILALIGVGAMIYPWAYNTDPTLVKISAFFMQFFVQGAFSVVPPYLAELSPPVIRATFPGLVYNLGHMISSSSAQIESSLGEAYPVTVIDSKGNITTIPNYSRTQALLTGVASIVLFVVVIFGDEKRGRDLTHGNIEDISEEETVQTKSDAGKVNSECVVSSFA